MNQRISLVSMAVLALTGWLAFRSLALPWPDVPRRPNVFVITVDSLRADHLGAYGYGRPTSPNLDRLAREGVLFERLITQASWTNASLVSVWTSRYPSVHGVEGRGVNVPAGLTTPLHQLQAAGYAVPGVSYLTQTKNYANLGFQRAAQRDPLAWLDANSDRPFFLWVHLIHPHLPYKPEPDSLARFDKGERLLAAADAQVIRTVRRHVIIKRGALLIGEAERVAIASLYDGEVFEADREVGRLLDGLKARGLADSTLVIVSADHGEELGDHGHVGHASTSLAATLYQELVQAPLIMRFPGVLPRGRRAPQLVEGIDLMPTVLDLLRIPRPAGLQGRSMAPLLFDRRAAWPERAFAETTLCGFQCRTDDGLRLRMVRTPRWKYIERSRGARREAVELYDLARDPTEQNNLAEEAPAHRQRLATLLEEIQASNQRRRREMIYAPLQLAAQPRAAAEGALEVLAPRHGEVLSHGGNSGVIVVRWKGNAARRYRIQYDIGRAEYRLRGEFDVTGTEHVYGPFSKAFWSRFILYNPWRFRVAPEGSSAWSHWITFQVAS